MSAATLPFPSVMNSQNTYEIQGLVISDTHMGAPYSDIKMTEDTLNKELQDKRITFCVMLGDIYENATLPTHHLPKTNQEAFVARIKLIREYAKKRGIELKPSELSLTKNITELTERMGSVKNENELNTVLGKINELFGGQEDSLHHLQNIYHNTRLQQVVLDEMAQQHVEHLQRLLTQFPHVTFHYVIGNHERLPGFIAAVKKLSKQVGEDRLKIYEDYVKIGDGLFIHGDQQLDEKKFHIHEQGKYDTTTHELNRSANLQSVHNWANIALPKLASNTLYSASKCASAILQKLHAHSPEVLEGVKHIYFGHTHGPFTNKKFTDPYDHKEYIFHNTGAAISRLKLLNKNIFNPLRITLTLSPDSVADRNDSDVFYQKSTITHNVRAMEQEVSRAMQ